MRILFAFFFLVLALSNGNAQPLVFIPDPALRTALRQNGLLTKDSLDVYKTWGKKTLDISNSNITNLQGLQYFSHLIRLDCSHNKIIALKHLPETLKELDCANNFVVVIRELPPKLEKLDCSYNNINVIRHLPSTLKELNCSNNNLVRLPDLPSGIRVFNYSHNPVDERKLPYSYRMAPCIYENQNCIPNTAMNFNILNNNFTIQNFNSIRSLRVTVIEQWGRGSIESAYDFSLKGKYYVLHRKVVKSTTTGLPEYVYKHPKYSFPSENLYPILLAIQEQMLNINIRYYDREYKLNLIDNLNSIPVIKQKSRVKRYMIWFQFYTADNSYTCYYDFDDSIEEGLTLAPSNKPNDLREILNWLYCYQLVQVVLPPEESIARTFFGHEQLEKILYIEGYGMEE